MIYKQAKPESKNMIIGLRPVIEAIEAGKSIDKLFIQRGLKIRRCQNYWSWLQNITYLLIEFHLKN